MKRTVSLVLVCVLMPATALAFEMNGVRSGMAYHEVVTKLERQGFEVIPQEMFGNAALLVKRGKESDLLQFCNGKLTSYTYNLSGDIHTYLRLVGQMTSQRGAGQYEVQLNEGRHGPLNALMFKWVEEPDTITVVYAAPSAQVKETVSMLYSVTKKCPK